MRRKSRFARRSSRLAAKPNYVAADLATECEVQFAYAISHAQPVGVRIDTFGKIDDPGLT
ncbi:MAG: methionine adenosyltransferase domain-containing protein [Verrucomicrobiaceae bacterium]|nr:methionine adenosyltransferase domain-containing protein [Verrucomicrobiaceae bacterium]